ncbi:MAG: phosphoadenosine phosphosulfate sulfotransferase, partial [Eggerthellaceae bacterium]
MPDISLRFDKDMLVLSTPIDFELKAQGFTKPGDREYVGLCEPELIEDVYNLEQVLETPVFVT